MLENLHDALPVVVALSRGARNRDGCPVGLARRLGPAQRPRAKAPRTISGVLAELARPPQHSAPLLARGTRIKRLEIVRPIATGGSATVYEARDPAIGRSVAVKLYHRPCAPAEGCDFCMLDEARAAARLQHPNVVALYDVGQHRGHPYLVLELLRGETLANRLLRGPLPLRDALRTSLAIAEVLALAHRHGLVHGDVKPGNVFLTREGTVKLLDFGLSSRPHESGGDPAGTPAYMAPELLAGGHGDARSDVFSAAMVLRESLLGRRRARRGSNGGKASDEEQAAPRRPPLLVSAIVDAALSPRPDDRPQSGAAWLAQLRRARDLVAPEARGRV